MIFHQCIYFQLKYQPDILGKIEVFKKKSNSDYNIANYIYKKNIKKTENMIK